MSETLKHKLVFPQRSVVRGEPLEFTVLSSSDAELTVYAHSPRGKLYKEDVQLVESDGILRYDSTKDISDFPLGEVTFTLTEKRPIAKPEDEITIFIDDYGVPDWVRNACIIEYVAGAPELSITNFESSDR